MGVAAADGYLTTMVALGVAGFGLGLLIPNLNTWMLALAPAPLRGRLMGILGASFFLGQFASPLLSAPLVRGGTASAFAAVGAGAGGVALCFLVYSAVDSARSRTTPSEQTAR